MGLSQGVFSSMFLLSLLSFPSAIRAATVTRDFSVGWVNANPDGAFERPTIGINGHWPLPLISATVGDKLILNVHNDLGNASTSLHFHGLFQNGTNHMDGAVGVTQCAIPPGSSFRYEINFDQPGTYWYHAHNDGQYPEGLRGPVVIHDPQGPYEGKYDEELVITLSDWYHRPVKELIHEFISVGNPTGAEPVPQAALMNDTQNLQIKVRPKTTYLVRLVNIGAFANHFIWFEGHDVQVVEVDGVWTKAASTSGQLFLSPAQRYSVLLTTRDDASQNFPIVSAMDKELFDVIPDDLRPNVTGWLVYDDDEGDLPEPTPLDGFSPFDDFTLVPYDGEALYDQVDQTISLDIKMDNLGDGANYAFFNDVTYVAPKVPSLYTSLTVGSPNASIPQVYGTHTNPFILLPHNQVIQIILNNEDDGIHPFHLHGHNFQLVHRSEEGAGKYLQPPQGHDTGRLPSTPMRRDTVHVKGNGNIVLRFKADNPGVWLFHCHIEWHMDQGLVATIVEAPDKLQGLAIPDNHLAACRAAGIPTAGNAAGNTKNVMDLTGEPSPPRPLPPGFTAKGYVAFGFSCLSALLGLAAIAWYGTLNMDGERQNGAANSASRRSSSTSPATSSDG